MRAGSRFIRAIFQPRRRRLPPASSRPDSGRTGWDPAVAGLPVSGAYPLQDTDRILAAIAETLPVSLQKITRYWVRVTPDR